MKITFVRETFLSGLNNVYQAVPSKTVLPILNNFYFECSPDKEAILSATNLEISITQRIPVISCEGDFVTAIPAAVLVDLVKAMKDDLITLEFSGTEVSIEGKQSKNKIKLLPANDFPFDEYGDEYDIVTDGDGLRKAIQRTIVSAAATTVTHAPILQGVLIESLFGDRTMLISIDGFRYSFHEIANKAEFGKDFTAVVPAAQLAIVAKALSSEEVRIGREKNKVIFKSGNVSIGCLVSEGQFPDYKQFPKSTGTKISLPTAMFLAACKQAMIFVNPEKNRLYLTLEPMFVHVSSEAQQNGESSVSCLVEYVEGNPGLNIILNGRFLLEILSLISSDKVFIEFKDARNPAMFRIDGEEKFLHGIQAIAS